MDCPRCSGRCSGCITCHGTGRAECNCGSPATSLSLFDRAPQCAACAVIDYSEQLEYLTRQGLTERQAQRWIQTMPSLTDAEIRRLGGLGDEAYIAEVAAVCGGRAA